MKTRSILYVTALLATLFALPVTAQPAPMDGMGPGGMQRHAPRDCAQAPNPERCQAHRAEIDKARAACKSAEGPQRRQCMREQMQQVDCSKTGNPQHCEARKAAHRECQAQTGQDFRQCMQAKKPPVDCAKAPDPARCTQHQKARAACENKVGEDHRACLREQFNVK